MSRLADLPATFTAAQAREARLQNRDLYQARDAGEVYELSRGVFRKASAPTSTYPGLLAVAHRAPRAVVCMLSAAAVHGLTDELPLSIQIAVPRRTWRPRIEYPPVKVFQWDSTTFDLGLTLVEAAEGEHVRVYSPARTVVDLMRLRQRVGESIAHIALRRYVSSPQRRIAELITLATALDVLGPVRAAVDVLTAS
jgi:predicted transcriptional regulator of viral defense system